MKGQVVTSASNSLLLFLRNPGTGFCSGADIKKLDFRLEIASLLSARLTVAVGCVHAAGLKTTLDHLESPKNAPCFVSEDKRIVPSQMRAQLRRTERVLLPAPPCFSPVPPMAGITSVSRR